MSLRAVLLLADVLAWLLRSDEASCVQCCCTQPKTGYYRDGFCATGPSDRGVHVVCSRVTQEFLTYSASRGNDLQTPHPPSFPGLKPGDRWCLCASRWKEALDAGVAPPVYLDGCHEKALEFVSMDQLKAHALEGDDAFDGAEL